MLPRRHCWTKRQEDDPGFMGPMYHTLGGFVKHHGNYLLYTKAFHGKADTALATAALLLECGALAGWGYRLAGEAG